MVRIGSDLLVLGGYTSQFSQSTYTKSVYKLSCKNSQCKWETFSQKLAVPRSTFVAIPVPDYFVTCTCKMGYTGAKCNDCDDGYYEVDNINGKRICSGDFENYFLECTIFSNPKISYLN